MGDDKREAANRGFTKATRALMRAAAEEVSVSPSPAAPARSALSALLSTLLEDDTGWLRMVPDGGSKAVYLKWKWTAGKLAGRYVMAVGDVWQLEYLLALLADKRDAAMTGTGHSTKDRPYDGE